MMIEVCARDGAIYRYYNADYKLHNHRLSIYSRVNGKCICDWFEWTLATKIYQDDDGNWITEDIDTNGQNETD